MSYYVYVLYSDLNDKIYIGTSSDPEKRLFAHNHLPKGWTKSFRPWRIIHVEEFPNKSIALRREKGLKSHQGRNFIRKEILGQE